MEGSGIGGVAKEGTEEGRGSGCYEYDAKVALTRLEWR